jgi:putative FmdB family regulatory protein
MPLYEYFCDNCEQVFTKLRTMSEYREPAGCPVCASPSDRIVASAPRLNTMRAETRKAHQVNERSAHEPRMSHGHSCGAGCNHHHHNKTSKTEQPKIKQQNGKRPWMLGH